MILFHGTPNGNIDRFDTTPIYFCSSVDVASAYATHNFSRDENGFPSVVKASVNLINPKVLTEQEALDLVGYDEQEGEICWLDFENLLYHFEDNGYDGVILLGAKDFAGTSPSGERLTARYDQYIAFNAAAVTIEGYVTIAPEADLDPAKPKNTPKNEAIEMSL